MSAALDKIKIVAVDHIQLDVADIEESRDFYARVFGFEVKEVGIRAFTRWMTIGANETLYLCMHEYAEGRGVKNDGLEITHFGILVEDFDRVLTQLRDHGVKLLPDYEVQYHSSRSVYFIDPNGYKVEISEKYGGGIESARHTSC
ncbi:Metallothiol transferase FosB [compost metagenome]|jgi:lactoylglutathione lyase|uniref:VOC family protein n=1 Tax=Pseudomonas germanica TaxID=2815720 RepID=A0ABX8YH40_9PSED|nr:MULTISPECIES: VOC family protein [Pseudomonas]MCL9800275.1 VOC family protein [Pseudomonas sp. AKS31]MDT3310007.1 VOC family protein [Pseudomonas sp. rhizo66]QYY79301.1 VOC family protein [Pseudomonas germanica]UVL32216.1 VOC family protein [Pseudomonas sp. B21-041]WPN72096.1 VOC family protein [Pseudomonas germanica]